MGVTGPGGANFFRGLGERITDAADAAHSAVNDAVSHVVRGTAPARPAPGAPAAAPAASPAVYGGWERFLNGVSSVFGKDRELDELSAKLTALKERAFADKVLTPAEAGQIRAEQARITAAYDDLAARRGFPRGALRPTSEESFKVYGEDAQIQFEWLSGKELHVGGGALGELSKVLAAGPQRLDRRALDGLAAKIAFDLVTSPSPAVAKDKVNLLRAELARTSNRDLQKTAMAAIATALDATTRTLGPGAVAMTRAQFEAASRSESAAAAHATKLPDEVKGNRPFPNKPIPGWEAEVRAATKASLDDLQTAGKLFLDKVPPGGPPKTVAIKLDLNLGMDGPPTVSDPAATGATVAELIERSKAQGKQLRFTVGDSSGGENIPLGRTSMDIMRDTGNYHHALKAGLAAAAKEGSQPAAAALQKIEAAERRGVYFGGKDDKVSTPADLKAAEDAAAKYVTCVDYDAAGFKSVDPKLGPLGLAAWGTREFQIAKPWAEADFRVHVGRSISTHMLAGWTGPTKGLIGLHAFGLRPVDQGMNKRGGDALDGLLGLTQAAGVLSIFQSRTGASDVAARILASGDPALKKDFEASQSKFAALRSNTRAWAQFSSGAVGIAAELKRARAAGQSEAQVMDQMRWKTRALLDQVESSQPGFRQALWDAVQGTTKVLMQNGTFARGLLPKEIRDEDTGQRIGLLTALPYPSDLVISSQPKIGEGGGPDAYRKTTDAGFVVAATDEPTADAMAWSKTKGGENIWANNWPVNSALRYGKGPMAMDEIKDVSRNPR